MERFETAGGGGGGEVSAWAIYVICMCFSFMPCRSYIILMHITSPPVRDALGSLAATGWLFLLFPLSILLLCWRNASQPSPIPTS